MVLVLAVEVRVNVTCKDDRSTSYLAADNASTATIARYIIGSKPEWAAETKVSLVSVDWRPVDHHSTCHG